jgi:hypothetical protein
MSPRFTVHWASLRNTWELHDNSKPPGYRVIGLLYVPESERTTAESFALVFNVPDMLRALKAATDALTVARGWVTDDTQAAMVQAALKQVVTVRANANDSWTV